MVSEAVEKQVLERVVHPAIRGMASEGTPYAGVLYVGLMIDGSGAPRVVEFNARDGLRSALARTDPRMEQQATGSSGVRIGADGLWRVASHDSAG